MDQQSAGRPLPAVLGRLLHQLPIDGGEDSLFSFAEPRVGLGRLHDGHHGLSLGLVARDVPEVAGERVVGQSQHPL